MPTASCIFEVYEVTCNCGTKFKALVEPQEPHAKIVESGDKYQIAGAKCPACGLLAVFLGPVARPVSIEEE